MIPITQTRVGKDGNCMNACLASILEVPLKDIPEFKGEDQPADVDAFLRSKHSMSYRRVPVGSAKPVGYSTIEGYSPRGGFHACVAKNGKLVHDPHPQDGTGRGLVEPYYYGVLTELGQARDTAAPMAEVRAIIHGWSFADTAGVRRRLTKAEDFMRISRLSSSQCKALDTLLQPLREELGQARDARCAFKVLQRGMNFPKLVSCRRSAVESSEFCTQHGKLKVDSKRDPAKEHYKTLLYVSGLRARKKPVADRADMLQLRKNTKKQGGPLLMQVTEKNGREHTVPTRKLIKPVGDAWGIVEGFTMKDNSVQTWDLAEPAVRRRWLAKRGLYQPAADYPWSEQTSKVQNAFVDWCRANHNV